MTFLFRTGSASAALIAMTLSCAAQTAPPSPAPAPATPASPPAAESPAAPSPVPPAPIETERSGQADNQIADDVDARIAQLKASLRLTVEEDGKWAPLQTSLHDYGVALVKRRYAYEDMMGRREGRERDRDRDRDRDRRTDASQSADDKRPNHLALMRWEAEDMAARAEHLKKIADAAEPIYATLGERQRRTLIRFVEGGFDKTVRRAGRSGSPF